MPDDKMINSKPFSDISLSKVSAGKIISDSASKTVNDNTSSAQTLLKSTNNVVTYAPPMPISGAKSISDLLSNSVHEAANSSVLLNPITVPTYTIDVESSLLSQSVNSFDSSTDTQDNVRTIANSQDLGDATDETQNTEEEQEESIIQYLDNLDHNILNDIDQATYHLKLFLVKADLIKNQSLTIQQLVDQNPNIFSNENIIIVAESGVNAGIYIDRFTIENVLTVDPQFNTSGVSASLQLKEPLGANFIDYYNDALFELGYETRLQPPLFMEVSFRGYHDSGSYVEADDIGTKIYRLVLADISADFTGSGTQYDLLCRIQSDIAREIGNTMITDSLSIQGKTVKDFFDKLMEEWNKPQRDIEAEQSQPPAQTTGTAAAAPTANSSLATIPPTNTEETPTPVEKNEFKYEVKSSCIEYKDCLNWEVGKASKPDRYRVAQVTYNDESGTIQATWAPGSTRSQILADLIMSTKEAQTLIVNGKKGDEIKPGSKEIGGLSYLPEIDIGVEMLAYNAETHTYNKRIIYYVQERQTNGIITTPKELAEATKSREALIKSLKYVRRRYDYFGTGKNTEILNLSVRLSSDLKLNLPAYNAQKRTAVADNPGTGTEEVQQKQVADGSKVKSNEGVRKPSPTNPDQLTDQPDEETLRTLYQTFSTPVINDQNTNRPVVTVPPSSAEVNSIVNQIKVTDVELSNLSEDERIIRGPEFVRRYENLGAELTSFRSDYDNMITNYISINNVNSAVSSQTSLLGLGSNQPLDSLLNINTTPIDVTVPIDLTLTGTLAQGSYFNKFNLPSTQITPTPNAASQPTDPRFLEDLSRNRSDSPRPDRQDMERPGFTSTPINNSGGYNIDDSVGLGKSFVSAILGQVYGGTSDMAEVNMEIRGDPLWLAVTNKAHTDQMGSLRIDTGEILTRDASGLIDDRSGLITDQKVLMVVVFPTTYDESTGLAIPNRISEGFTAIYNVIRVTSTFEGGKFTQSLVMRRDLATEQIRQYLDPIGGANL